MPMPAVTRPAWLPRPTVGTTADWTTIGLLAAVGLAGSWRHVLTLAHTHGADGWPAPTGSPGVGAWLVAGVWEVMAVFSSVEIIRRRGWGRAVPAAVASLAAGFVILANLEGSGLPVLPSVLWRVFVAVSPIATLLAISLLVETRTWRRTRRAPAARRPAPERVTVGTPPVAEVVNGPTPAGGAEPLEPDALDGRVSPAARQVWRTLAEADGPLGPGALVTATGIPLSTVKDCLTALQRVRLVRVEGRGRYVALHATAA